VADGIFITKPMFENMLDDTPFLKDLLADYCGSFGVAILPLDAPPWVAIDAVPKEAEWQKKD
jgi:hypothetical protein